MVLITCRAKEKRILNNFLVHHFLKKGLNHFKMPDLKENNSRNYSLKKDQKMKT